MNLNVYGEFYGQWLKMCKRKKNEVFWHKNLYKQYLKVVEEYVSLCLQKWL